MSFKANVISSNSSLFLLSFPRSPLDAHLGAAKIMVTDHALI